MQRNARQQQRIADGASSGALSTRESGQLQQGQAHATSRQARSGADGHVGAAEQRRVQAAQTQQSHRVYRKKHNAVAASE